MGGNFTAQIGARITEFMARMRQVQNTIRTTANDVRVDIGADIAQFKRKTAEVKAKMLALSREKVVIKIEARIEEFQNKINRIATNIRAFGELMQHTLMGTMMAVFPAIVPLIANLGVAIANLGPMIGVVAGSTFALAGAFGIAGAAVGAFAAVAIPSIKNIFEETGEAFTKIQLEAFNAKNAVVDTYDDLVAKTEKPVLQAFTKAMGITNRLMQQTEPLVIASAQAVDNLMASLSKAIETPPVQKFLEYLNTSGGPMLETFGRSFGNVFQGLLSMLTAFAPLSASTAKGFEDMTARFAEWSAGLSESVKFQAFIDYVNENMPKIRAIFRDAIAGIIYFFSAFSGSASGMMDSLVDVMARFKEWSATLSQNKGFQQFMDYVHQTAPGVMQLIGNLTQFLVNLGIGMAPLGAVIIDIANKVLEFVNSMMEGNRSIGIIIAGLISFGGILLAVVPNLIAFSTFFKDIGPVISKFKALISNMSSPLMTFGSAILNAVKSGRLFGLVLGGITSPISLVIIAITAFVAILIGLYNTNETFRAQVQTVWEAIKTAISTVMTAIGSLISSIWTQITTFWNENQANIMATASTVWTTISTVITTVMSAIGAIMQFIWPVVKALIVSTWTAIQNVIQGATAIILGIIQTFSSLFQGDWQGVWDGIKQILSGALQAVWGAINLYFVGKLLGPLKGFGSSAKSLMTTVWNAIKGIFTNTLNTIKNFVTTSFSAMKNVITTIWNGIKSFFSTVLNAIKSIMTTVWNAIKSVITSVMGGIRSTITSIWNAIKSVISSVLNGIKSVVTSIWNGIKSFISSVVNGIKSIVESTWNAIKSAVETAMNGVKTAIETGWNAAKSFLEGISLIQIGKDIIRGLINGIGAMFGAVQEKISALANLIPDWAKKMLGIHSPSRVMIAIAKWIPIGVAVGIDRATGAVVSSTKNMAKKAIPDFSQTLAITKEMTQKTQSIVANSQKAISAEVIAIQKDYGNKYADVTNKAEARVREIRAKAADKKRGLTAAEQRNIHKIYEDAKAQREKLALAETKAMNKIKVKSQKETLEALKDYADQQIALEKWSTKQQAEYWKYATTAFVEGTDERIQAQINYNKSMADLNQEKFNQEKNFIDRVKKYNQMSLAEELSAYQKYVQQYKAGSEERIYYEDKIADTKQAIHDKLLALNDEYLNKIQEAKQKEIDGIEALNKAYSDAVDARQKSIYSTFGLFDQLEQKVAVSGQSLINNLRMQNKALSDWAVQLSELGNKGIDDGLLQELQAMGPKASAEIEALNKLSAKELDEYTNLWRTKAELARTQAEAEHVALKETTAKQITELTKQTATQLDAYKKEWAQKIKEVNVGTTNQFNAMVATMPQIGANVIRGMQQGLSNMTPSLLAQAKAIADAIKATIQSALDIHSPSRWGKKMVGHNLIKGIIIGLADMKSDAIKAAEQVAEWIQPSVEVKDIVNQISSAIDDVQSEIEHKVKVNVNVEGEANTNGSRGDVKQEVHLHSPKHLSPAENARQLKRVAQQLVFE